MKRKIIKSLDELNEFLKDFNKETFSFDTETTSLDYDTLELLGISLCDGKKACYIKGDYTPGLEPIFNAKEQGKGLFLIAHNFVYDAKVLLKYGINLYNAEWFDTMVADHLILETRQHGLKNLTRTLLGKEVVEYDEVSANPDSEEFANYAIDDAINTWKLAQLQRQELMGDEQLFTLFRRIEMPFLRVIVEMETQGILVDWEKIQETTIQLQKEIMNLESKMYDLLGEDYTVQTSITGENLTIEGNINFNSSKQLVEILFNKLGLEVLETTPKGNPSVGKNTIYKYAQKNEFVKILSQYKIASKLYTSFFSNYDKYRDSDDKIRPSFKDTGTVTGRLSCTKPNLQQLPKPNSEFPIDTRRCFIVPEGYKMLTCDYAGQELRVLTEITKEPALIESFNKDKDLHLSTANDFFNLGIPEEALFTASDDYKYYKGKFKADRDKAKTINFGIAYGKGAFGFSKDFEIPESEAEKILEKYFRAMPKVKEAIDNCHKEVRTKGYVTSMTGRRRHFQRINGMYPMGAYRQAFNFLIQGFSADMIRLAGIKLLNLKKNNPDWELTILATVHDEYIMQIKEEYVSEATPLIKTAFESVVNFSIPIIADVSVGDNYSESK